MILTPIFLIFVSKYSLKKSLLQFWDNNHEIGAESKCRSFFCFHSKYSYYTDFLLLTPLSPNFFRQVCLCSHRCNVLSWTEDTVVRDRDKTLELRDRNFKNRSQNIQLCCREKFQANLFVLNHSYKYCYKNISLAANYF